MPVCLHPLGNGRPIALDKAIVLIGRHPDCDVVLTCSRKISRKHCCLAQVNNNVVIRDLGSMNGIWVNGERVQRQESVRLGDEVSIGDVRYRLQEMEAPAGKKRRGPKRSEPRQAQDERPAGVPQTPLNLSQDIPIPIPDEGEDFAVEPSMIETPQQVLGADLDVEEDDDDDDFIEMVPLDDDDSVEVIQLIDDDDLDSPIPLSGDSAEH